MSRPVARLTPRICWSSWSERNRPAQATGPDATLRHRIMAGFIGNVVEWYDFALYGYLAGVIAPVFFPLATPRPG